jgi:molybdate transport system substrate-binding protein
VLIAILAILCEWSAPHEPLRIAVAASLQDAIGAITPLYERATGGRIETVIGSSGQLASQVRYGAPIDVIISAADEPLALLERDGLLAAGSVRTVASNRLVLVVPREPRAEIAGFRDLPRATVGRLVIGDPATVPAGQYAAQVLDALDLSDALRGRIVHAANVRQALAYVERGEVDAGIVYETDARISAGRVRVIEVADAAWHQPIRYSAGIVERSQHRDAARALLEFLADDEAQRVFGQYGFLPPAQLAALSAPAATAASRPAEASASQPSAARTPPPAAASRPSPATSPAAASRPGRSP